MITFLLYAAVVLPRLSITGAQAIREMERMYASLHSYSDTGILSAGDQTIRFRTVYQAPGKMYFEYKQKGELVYFCAPGVKGFEKQDPVFPSKPSVRKPTWMADSYLLGQTERDSLSLTIAGFTGISRGTAYEVPTMLYPPAVGVAFHDLKAPKIVRRERIAGERCYVVQAEDATLWIGIQTHALRKLQRAGSDGPETFVYRPQLNPKVDPRFFIFRHPTGRMTVAPLSRPVGK